MNARTSQADRNRLTQRLRRLAAGLTLIGATSCASAPPPYLALHDLGQVRAESRDQAEQFKDLVSELQPKVIEVLPDAESRSTEVWVQQTLRHRRGAAAPDNVKGFTLISGDARRGRIHLREDTDYPEWFLAHELVHSLLGSSWNTIPGVLEEGMCDVVAAELNPEVAPRIRALRAIEASLFLGKLQLQLSHLRGGERKHNTIWFHYDRGESSIGVTEAFEPGTLEMKQRWAQLPDSLYGLGFLVASRIEDNEGLQGLHSMCRRAQAEGLGTVPFEWLMDAAELESLDALTEAPRELLGRDEFDEWVGLLPAFHGELLVQLYRPAFANLTGKQFLARVDPQLHLADGSTIELAAIPAVREAVLRNW